jgi:hypothetical protein
MKKCKKCKEKNARSKEARGHYHAELTMPLAYAPTTTYEQAYARYSGAPAPEARVGRGHTQNPYDRVVADLESQIAQARSNIVHIKAQKLHSEIEDMVVQTYEQHIEVAERDMEIAQHKRAFFAAGKPTVMRQYTELRDMYDEVGLSQPTLAANVGNPHSASRQTLIEAMTSADGFDMHAEMLGSEEDMAALRTGIVDMLTAEPQPVEEVRAS